RDWSSDVCSSDLRPAFAAEASRGCGPGLRNGQSAACASTGKGIGHQNGVFSVGTGRQKGDWRAHQLLDVANVLYCSGRQFCPTPSTVGALAPALEGFINRLRLGLQ